PGTAYDAVTGSPAGPGTTARRRSNPAATAASTVPSPPSATGSSTTGTSGRTRRSPAATRAATSGAASEPLNLSGATTTWSFIPALQVGLRSRLEVGEAGDARHFVHGGEAGALVGLRQGRVVEDRVDEIVDGAAASHDGLPDVHEFRGAGAEDVDAQQPAILRGHQQLEHPVGVADDLSPGQLAIAGDADFEG